MKSIQVASMVAASSRLGTKAHMARGCIAGLTACASSARSTHSPGTCQWVCPRNSEHARDDNLQSSVMKLYSEDVYSKQGPWSTLEVELPCMR